MSEHPNAARAREGFARFVQGDLSALLDLFADDAVWHVPGSMALSGAHRGREAIIAFLRGTAELTGGSYRVELLWTVADDDHLVAVYRALGRRPDGRELDVEQALLVELEGRRWKVVRAQPLDQAAFDVFWDREMPGADLRMLVEEQAALNRVAVTVATETSAERVFDVVTEEVARLLGADAANLVCFGPTFDDGMIVGKWSEPGVQIPGSGTVVEIADGSALSRVARTGAPARMATDDPGVPAELHERLVALGVTSLVAAPIVVSGAIWGALVVSVTRDLQFAANAEERLGQFSSLVAVAIANTQAREELATLAEEQAALSRVAVAVATEEQPERLFSTVSEEIGRLFGARAAATVRYVENLDAAEIVGGWERDGNFEAPLGVRLPFQGGAIARVAQTGRTARIDLENEPPDVQEHMRAAGVSSGVAAPIVVSGRLWGATSISLNGPERFPPDVETRLEKFTSLVAVALSNAEAREQLTASRARIVQAGDAERRRLERNLHDGAQQRLVSLALRLRVAESTLAEDAATAAELIAAASDELALGLEELRELARGIHPAVLTDHGLTPAVEALAARATLPVEVNGLPPERLAEPIEAAAFYVVSESLANIAKYARASQARIDLARDDGLLVVEVSDDGAGGADADKGSGLRGLSDRVEALGGRLRVSSEPGSGTTVRAELPVQTSSARAGASRRGGA